LCDEAESPRGRIALIQGWAEGAIPASRRLQRHLDNCLECRACEGACPSLVRFGTLMDDARALAMVRAGLLRRLARRAWLGALASRVGTRAVALAAAVYRSSGAARLARRTALVSRPLPATLHKLALGLRHPTTPRRAKAGAAAGPGAIGLFLGCIGRAAQPEALDAAIRVLERLDLEVKMPRAQGCCGAMFRHNGLPREADELLSRNAAAFGSDVGVGIASACVAELRTDPRLRGFQEICRFLADLPWPANLHLRPLRERVAVHEPCSQRNALRDPTAAYDLVRRIPGLDAFPLPDNAFCCGAAGTYLLQHPGMAQALLAPKIASLAALGAKILVTTNPGCTLHLRAGIAEAGLPIRVMHPVELVALQLPD
jgi:glycolate oxidase iron-sulfur subunit